jgi:hypothetical protein
MTTNEKPVTLEEIEQALRNVAYVISEHGRVEFLPIMERLEREIKAYRDAQDPVSRARAILDEYKKKEIAHHG